MATCAIVGIAIASAATPSARRVNALVIIENLSTRCVLPRYSGAVWDAQSTWINIRGTAKGDVARDSSQGEDTRYRRRAASGAGGRSLRGAAGGADQDRGSAVRASRAIVRRLYPARRSARRGARPRADRGRGQKCTPGTQGRKR